MQPNKLRIIKLLEEKEIEYESFRETIRVRSKESLIAFYPTGNIGLVDDKIELLDKIDKIEEHIKTNW